MAAWRSSIVWSGRAFRIGFRILLTALDLRILWHGFEA